jgi:xylulokinase
VTLLCCVDIGSSSLKAALIDLSGASWGEVRVPYGGEETPRKWLWAFYAALEALGSTGAGKASALIISGNGPTLVPVIEGEDSGNLESLSPVYWYDGPLRLPEPARPGSGRAGKVPVRSPSLFLAKAAQFRRANPAGFQRLHRFFSPQEWLAWRLGAEEVTVIPHRGYETYYWDEEQCQALGLKLSFFPPFVGMGKPIGRLSFRDDPADNPGADNRRHPADLLPPGIPLIAAASDFIMALIGTNTLESGRACDRTGSSEGINLCTAERPSGEYPKLRILPGAVEGSWNLGVVIPRSGRCFDEYRRAAGLEERSPRELIAEILDDPFHPGRPVLEGMGRAFLGALGDLEAAGMVRELVLSGGQAGDPRWNQYKADLSGRILYIPAIIDAELAGNAVLGALALEELSGTEARDGVDGGGKAPGSSPFGERLRARASSMIRTVRSYSPKFPRGGPEPRELSIHRTDKAWYTGPHEGASGGDCT